MFKALTVFFLFMTPLFVFAGTILTDSRNVEISIELKGFDSDPFIRNLKLTSYGLNSLNCGKAETNWHFGRDFGKRYLSKSPYRIGQIEMQKSGPEAYHMIGKVDVGGYCEYKPEIAFDIMNADVSWMGLIPYPVRSRAIQTLSVFVKFSEKLVQYESPLRVRCKRYAHKNGKTYGITCEGQQQYQDDDTLVIELPMTNADEPIPGNVIIEMLN